MKTLQNFSFCFPLNSVYASANNREGLNTLKNGAVIISGAYRFYENEPLLDHADYELAPGTTLTNLLEWLQYNSDEQITCAVHHYLRTLIPS